MSMTNDNFRPRLPNATRASVKISGQEKNNYKEIKTIEVSGWKIARK